MQDNQTPCEETQDSVAPETAKSQLTVNDVTVALSHSLENYVFSRFQNMHQKGRTLHSMMLADDVTAGGMMSPPRKSAESRFVNTRDLAKWGYSTDMTEENLPSAYIRWSEISLLLEILGFESSFSEDSNNHVFEHDHLATDSCFYQVINPVEGLMVAYCLFSPASSDRKVKPKLKFYSDVAWVQWSLRAQKESNLKYVLQYDVSNSYTIAVVKTINYKNGTNVLDWPGTTYDAGSTEGQALIGTPNGSGIAYLLIQHKAGLGHKTIDAITVFDWDEDLMMLFHIKDVV